MNQGSENSRDGNAESKVRTGFIEKYGPIVREGYRADFSRDTRINPPVFHYIISRDGSKEILVFAQAHSLESARAQAREEIDTLVRSTRKADSASEAS